MPANLVFRRKIWGARDNGIPPRSTPAALGESPIVKKRLMSKNYANEKLQKVGNTIRKRLRIDDDNDDDHTDTSPDDLKDIVDRLKTKFIDSGRSEQIQILTLAPSTWTVRRVMAEFGATYHMTRTAKQISTSEGIMATPNPKPGKALNNATANAVSEFCNSDSISRLMPGKRDCVSMRVDGTRENIQKRLILCNLREAYTQFKTEHQLPIGFSKFAALRPKNVILPGASGTHSVCVCTSHQNVKLMLHVEWCEIRTGICISQYTWRRLQRRNKLQTPLGSIDVQSCTARVFTWKVCALPVS